MNAKNRKKLLDMYTNKDAARLTDPRQEDVRLTNGPGTYVLEVEAVRSGTVKKPGPSFGKEYASFVFVVRSAEAVVASGTEHAPALRVGDRASHVLFLGNSMAEKELHQIVSAAAGIAPVYEIKEGKHSGKLLIMIDLDEVDQAISQEDFRDSSLYDSEESRGMRITCTIRPSVGKGKHEGKVFYNSSFFPCLDDAPMTRFPSLAELMDSPLASDIQDCITEQHGA